MNNYKMKELPLDEQPRERLKRFGKENLTDRELLSIILKTGTKDKNVSELSIDILKRFSLDNFKTLTINQLTNIKGIGEVKAETLIASIELGKRIYIRDNKKLKRLDTPEKIFNYTKYLFYDLKQEYFYVLYFNNKQELIGEKLLFKGTINKSITHPREVFKEAYLLSASSIVCIHNHPSNDTTPSNEDIEFTNALVKTGSIQCIPIIDHLIVGNDNYYSFYENSKINLV